MKQIAMTFTEEDFEVIEDQLKGGRVVSLKIGRDTFKPLTAEAQNVYQHAD